MNLIQRKKLHTQTMMMGATRKDMKTREVPKLSPAIKRALTVIDEKPMGKTDLYQAMLQARKNVVG